MRKQGKGGHKDGPLSDALFQVPRGILVDKDNNLILSDYRYIRLINLQTQKVQTIAGNGQYEIRYSREDSKGHSTSRRSLTSFFFTSSDGIGLEASFQLPYQLVMDSKGFIYLGDSTAVRRMSPQHEVITIARMSGTSKIKSISPLN
jgi:hypothetical protein